MTGEEVLADLIRQTLERKRKGYMFNLGTVVIVQ